MANKHTVVAMAAIAVIVATAAYSSMSALSVNDLQFRWHEEGAFDYLSVMFGGKIDVCNPSQYPANLKSYSVTMIYDKENIGTFSTGGANIPPQTITQMSGKFSANDRRIAEMMFSFLDTEMGGTDVTRIDGNKMRVHATTETSIIGFIPVLTTQEYSGLEFLQMMNQKTVCDT